jgi:hypothetical protein
MMDQDTAMQLEPDANPIDLLVKVEPEIVAAGGQFALTCAIRADNAEELLGLEVVYLDAAGNRIGIATLDKLDGSTLTTEPLDLRAPLDLGRHEWRALFSDPVTGEEAGCTFSIEVVAHRTSLLVWGAPTAVPAGADFNVMIGLKCSGGCNLAGHRVAFSDASGAAVGEFTMSADTIAGTSGLYQASATLRAPGLMGLQSWEARIEGNTEGVPHEPATARLSLNVVAAPEHRVEIEVTDAHTRAPLRNATVLLHPFRALTDEKGLATLHVAKNEYTLMVSAARHDPISRPITVERDYADHVRLLPEAKEDPDAQWV